MKIFFLNEAISLNDLTFGVTQFKTQLIPARAQISKKIKYKSDSHKEEIFKRLKCILTAITLQNYNYTRVLVIKVNCSILIIANDTVNNIFLVFPSSGKVSIHTFPIILISRERIVLAA